MCKKQKKFWKKAVLVALAAILGVSILAAPVSAAEDVKWTCYLVADGPQESVTRTSYVNPELATPSLICFPEFKNIGKPAEELRACECSCYRSGAEKGAISFLEDKYEVLLAEDCKDILHCTCKDMDIPASEHYRGMTPNEAIKWYDQARIKDTDKPTKDNSIKWVKDLAYEALINDIIDEIKTSGNPYGLSSAHHNFFVNPDNIDALVDYLIEKTLKCVDIWENAEWYDTEVLQGREAKDMTESEYQERLDDAVKRYPNRQKAVDITDGDIDALTDYLIDETLLFADRYCEEEKTYKNEDKQGVIVIVDLEGKELFELEEIPIKQVQPTPTPTIRPTERPSTLHTISPTAIPMPTTTPPPSTSITPTPIQDSDGDGWDDEQERRAGTNPHKVDTDGDGIWDPQDPNPSDPNIPQKSIPIPTFTPGFEAIFVIAGILAMAYLLKRRD